MQDKYTFARDLTIEKHSEGSLIMQNSLNIVICLGRFETELVEMILSNGLMATVQYYEEQYETDQVKGDIQDFCQELVTHGVFLQNENE